MIEEALYNHLKAQTELAIVRKLPSQHSSKSRPKARPSVPQIKFRRLQNNKQNFRCLHIFLSGNASVNAVILPLLRTS